MTLYTCDRVFLLKRPDEALPSFLFSDKETEAEMPTLLPTTGGPTGAGLNETVTGWPPSPQTPPRPVGPCSP